MGAEKVCVCLFVIFFNFHIIVGKPFFFSDSFWCDLLCEDDDDDASTTSTASDSTDYVWDDMFDICSDCPSNSKKPAKPNQPVNVMIPPMQQGVNLTMTNVGGSWLMNMVPWGPSKNNVTTTAGPATTTAAAATTAAPAATTKAAAETTKAAGTTTAAGTTKAGATTKAAEATTAKPTTAAG